MPRASDNQVQNYVDQRIRVRAEEIRALLNALVDDKMAMDDIYEHVNGANAIASTWADGRTDGPPTLATKEDVLEYNALISALIPHIRDAANWPAVLSLCVHPVNG